MNGPEQQMLQDFDRRIKDLERSTTRLRKGVVTETSPDLKIQLGGECGGQEILATANGPVSEGDVVTVLEGGNGVVVSGAIQDGQQSGLEAGAGIIVSGKEIAVDTSVARKNGSGQLLTVANPTSANHGANKSYADGLLAFALAADNQIPEVVSLPGSPADGQLVFFNGWLCRFDSSPPFSGYPWAVAGGSLIAANNSSALVTSLSYAAVPGGSMSISLPTGIKGIFTIELGGRHFFDLDQFAPDPNGLYHSVAIGSTAASDSWSSRSGISPGTAGISTLDSTNVRKSVQVITQAGATIAERARRDQASDVDVFLMGRWLEVTPQWIGT